MGGFRGAGQSPAWTGHSPVTTQLLSAQIFRATFGAAETSNQLSPEAVCPRWGRPLMLAGMRSCFLLSFLLVFSVVACLPAHGQINGVPASVTSFGFGGSNN